MNIDASKIRNIAIIAHVDHGKTTLVDAFMKQSKLFRDNQEEMNQEMILDSGDLEREKGITIVAKNISVRYGEYKINIIDTPGHTDFGGEVERTLNMADGCILLVDAQEGPKPQTKFVLQQAFRLGLKPILIINKIDKSFATPKKVLEKVNNLFLDLATDESQLEFPVFYAIGREGKVFTELPEGDLTVPNSIPGDLKPLLDAIVDYVPAPADQSADPFQMLITSLEYDSHSGRYLIGKINKGVLKKDQSLVVAVPAENSEPVIPSKAEGSDSSDGDGTDSKDQIPQQVREDTGREATDTPRQPKVITRGKVKKILVREGLNFVEVDSASSGEIVAIAGIDSTDIGATLCDVNKVDPLPRIKISNPSVRIKFEASTSPLVGKDGKFVTAKLLQQRLERELETNISLVITKGDEGSYYVAGRGELQLSILIETLRREGYEFQIRKPEVVMKEEDGVKMEPIEELVIDTNEEYSSTVASIMTTRRAELQNIETDDNGEVHYTYKILTRNLLGLRNLLLTNTKGNVVMNNYLAGYVPFDEKIPEPHRKGVLIASESGISMDYALNTIQWRGEMFIGGSEEVYEGMIVGIHKYEEDLAVNVCKERHKSGVRVNKAQITHVMLKPPVELTLDYALLFIAKDEMLEVTPKHLRLRKVFLKEHERTWAKRDQLTGYAKQMMEGK